MQLLDSFAAFESNLVFFAVTTHANLGTQRQSVNDGNTNAVKTTGNLVTTAAEFAAGMKDGKNNLDGRDLLFLMLLNRDATTVVDDRDRVVGMNEHLDMVAITSEGFVNRVIDYLVNQVMKATWAGSTNVHARALANGVKAFEDLDRIRAVVFFFVSHHTLLTMNRNRADGTPSQVGE